jgi:hypothetical protein
VRHFFSELSQIEELELVVGVTTWVTARMRENFEVVLALTTPGLEFVSEPCSLRNNSALAHGTRVNPI